MKPQFHPGACHALGLKGWLVETFPNYGPQFPSMYVAAKLRWNHKTDVDALLHDCFEKFFGPAAAPMGRYITLMDAALRDGDFCTGSAWDMPHFYPAKLRKDARALLDDGKKLSAGKGDYAARVQMITETFDMLEAFIAMMDARVRVDFVAAKAELDKLDAVAGTLMAYKPVPMLSAGRFSTYVSYTVCVANLAVNELGTGGILAPVILYAPVGGKDAQLRNVRDLKPTFP